MRTGHQQALERGGLLQKDISNGSILIVEEPQQDLSSKGVLHDYDFDPMMLGKPEEVSKSASSEQSPLHSPELANVLRAAAIELATRRERMVGILPDYHKPSPDSIRYRERRTFWRSTY